MGSAVEDGVCAARSFGRRESEGQGGLAAGASPAPALKTNWNMGPTSQENAPVAADRTTMAAMAVERRRQVRHAPPRWSRRYSAHPALVARTDALIRTPADGARLGRLLFRYRSFTPVPLLAVAALLVWRSRGPAPRGSGSLPRPPPLPRRTGALRAWVLGFVQDGTIGPETEKLIAVALNTGGPYALTRNPLYLGNLGITLGLCAIAHDFGLILLVAALFAAPVPVHHRGGGGFPARPLWPCAYEDYCARVPRFWPRPAPTGSRPWNWPRIVRKEHNPCAAWPALAVVLVWLDHRDAPLPFAVALSAIAALWLSAKAWKHHLALRQTS